MNKITNVFQNKKLFIPFLTAGYPDKEKFVQIVNMFDEIGAGIVEIGIPFSDPLADGTVIQDSSHYVLEKGMNVDIIFDLVKKIRQTSQIPIAFMTYYNLILNRGIEKFVNDAKDAGADGLIIPDLPPEEAEELLEAAKDKLAITFLVTTVSNEERIKYIADKTTGFVYFVARLGVTGSETVGQEFDVMKNKVNELKNITDKPVAVGFGIYNRAEALDVYNVSDGVIVGSAIIKFIKENENKEDWFSKLRDYCKQFV